MIAVMDSNPRLTSTPAQSTPIDIKIRAGQKRTPNKNATKDPVQAPVTGKGIATKVIRQRAPISLNRSLCLWRVLWKSAFNQ